MPVSAHDREWDVVVVGSGAAGLAAALAASAEGATVCVLEKASVLGGTTAMSSAGTWVPANHHMLAAGLQDSAEETLTPLWEWGFLHEVHLILEIAMSSAFCSAIGTPNRRMHAVCRERSGRGD